MGIHLGRLLAAAQRQAPFTSGCFLLSTEDPVLSEALGHALDCSHFSEPSLWPLMEASCLAEVPQTCSVCLVLKVHGGWFLVAFFFQLDCSILLRPEANIVQSRLTRVGYFSLWNSETLKTRFFCHLPSCYGLRYKSGCL